MVMLHTIDMCTYTVQVLDNIDELFDCEPFCAVMRHSELLNSGKYSIIIAKSTVIRCTDFERS